MSQQNEQSNEIEETLRFKPDLPNLIVDKVSIAYKKGGGADWQTFSLFQELPSGQGNFFEQTRFTMTTDHCKALIDILCKQLDYTPNKD